MISICAWLRNYVNYVKWTIFLLNFLFLFFNTTTLGKSLIKYVLVRIEEFLYQENLTVEWASFPAG